MIGWKQPASQTSLHCTRTRKSTGLPFSALLEPRCIASTRIAIYIESDNWSDRALRALQLVCKRTYGRILNNTKSACGQLAKKTLLWTKHHECHDEYSKSCLASF